MAWYFVLATKQTLLSIVLPNLARKSDLYIKYQKHSKNTKCKVNQNKIKTFDF